MASHANSTTVPTVQARLLPRRDTRGPFLRFEETPELPPEPLLPAAPDTPDAIRADLDALVATCGHMSTTAAEPRCADISTPSLAGSGERDAHAGLFDFDETGDLKTARTLHLRRQLAQAAEHGAALLASLGLPRLVGPDFVPLDPAAIGHALDLAIATLDALDGDMDLEDGHDAESDTADAEDDGLSEPSLASPERHPAVQHCSAPWSHVDRGPDSSQLRWAEGARDDREMVPEDGPIDEDELDGAGEVDAEPSIGWPEDFTAEVEATLEASADAEHDDADLEDDELGDDRDPKPLAWVFGPSRGEVAHV